MTKEEIDKIVLENIQLNIDIINLKKEQKEFQEALIKSIQEIKKLGAWQRFWGYWKIVLVLINTIEESIKNTKA